MPQLRASSISAIPPSQNGHHVQFYIQDDTILQPQSCTLIPLNHQFVNTTQNFCF